MVQQKLLKTQKDSLFNIVVEHGFNPKDFYWDDQEYVPTLIHTESAYFVKIQLSDNHSERGIKISPAEDIAEKFVHVKGGWSETEIIFSFWLTYLKRELETNDFWGQLSSMDRNLSLKDEITDDLFSPTEVELIHMKIDSIKVKIASLGLMGDQVQALGYSLDHLVDLTKKLGRRDWLSLLIGTLGVKFLDLALTPETIQAIWEIVRIQFEIWLILH